MMVIVVGLVLISGCAGKAQKMKMTWSAGAGAGVCSYDPKDRSLFDGNVDDSDTCLRLIGRVHGDREPPQRLIPQKGDPVIVPNGPFGELGFSDLGETGFDGEWLGTGIPTSDVGTIEKKAWHLAVGYSYPMIRRLGIFGRVGYAFWDVEEEEVFGGIPESHDASGEDPLFGLGLNVGLLKSLLLELEWSRYMNVGEEGVTGEDDLDAATLTFLYRF
jgi:hypothetical protein